MVVGFQLSRLIMASRLCIDLACRRPLRKLHLCLLQNCRIIQQFCCHSDTAVDFDVASAAVRGFTYQAIGQLASRVPSLFTSDVSIARRFFQSLSTEPAGVRSALQEAVSTLASAYKGCTGVTPCLMSSTQLR
jgi:hypothetical protein